MKTLLAGFLIAALSKLFADEVKEWLSWMPPKLIQWAAGHLAPGDAERFEEEWLAHCNDLPGHVAKLSHAIGCVTVYARCTNLIGKIAWWTLVYPFLEISFLILFVFDYVTFVLTGKSVTSLTLPEFVRARRICRNACGLTVLGLTDLDLKPRDFRASELRKRIQRSGLMSRLNRIITPHFAEKYYDGRIRLYLRILLRIGAYPNMRIV